MKRKVLQILGGLLVIVVVIAVIMPQHGRIKFNNQWRTNNISMWQKTVIDFIHANNKLPDDLYQSYVFSYESFKNTEFSTCIRSLNADSMKDKMKIDKSFFDKENEYRLIVLSKDIWYIMEYPSFPREGDYRLMIDQDGKVWKATKQ